MRISDWSSDVCSSDLVRLLADIETEAQIVSFAPWRAGEQFILAASDGRGFIAKSDDLLAETRKGRQVVTPRSGARLKVSRPLPADADYLAVAGDNRKLVIFPLRSEEHTSELKSLMR